MQKLKENPQFGFGVMTMDHFRTQNGSFTPNKNFFGKIINFNFLAPLDPLLFFKSLNKSQSESRVITMHHFWTQSCPFGPNKFYFGKSNDVIFMYLLAPFIVQNLKKVLRVDAVMTIRHFWVEMANWPKQDIYRKSNNIFLIYVLPSFIA